MDKKEKEFEQKIAELKEKHTNIYLYEVVLADGSTAKLILKQPSRKVLAAATAASNGDSLKYNEIILKNSLIEGDASLLDDDSIFYGLSSKLEELITIRVGELKKL